MADPNKTEKATPHRRKKAREEGQIVRSREFGGLLAMLAAIIVFSMETTSMAQHWVRFYEGLLTAASSGSFDLGGPILFWTAVEVLRWTVPPLSAAVLCSVAISFAQGGFNIAPSALSPKFERLNPASHLGQVFSANALGGLIRSMLPFVAIALLSVATIAANWSALARSSGGGLLSIRDLVLETIYSIAWKAAIVLLLAAALDYFLSWRQNEGKLRMSHEEIKREFKENDGNPFIKGQIRRRQRAMRARKPVQAAATATMVITNPTHFAVALRYEPAMAAPEVVAKGQDMLAQKIKQIAGEHNVPMIENKPLARALYRNVEVGDTIPPELYQAVAEILVTVFRAQDEVRRRDERARRLDASGASTADPESSDE